MRFLLLGLLCATVAYAQAFIPHTPDVPLPDGAETETVFSFSTEQARIMQVMVYAPESVAETQAFYRDTLPQLGWKPTNENTFKREADSLTLEQVPQEDGSAVFRLDLMISEK